VQTSQKLILGLLAIVAVVVLVALGVTAALLLKAPAVPHAAAPQPLAAAATPTATATPPATFTPTTTPYPTPTGTRVVQTTVQPSPSPTRANCGSDVINFGASGLLTDDDVRAYLAEAIPPAHLDYCRGIEYVPTLAKSHGSEISGNIIPGYREIYVYALPPELQNPDYLLDTLVHEIGHNVHMNIRRDNFDLDVQWAELYRQSLDMAAQNGTGFVSLYARSSKFEDFAESYRAYVRDPNLLLAYNPAKYEFMRANVFDGREYR